MKKLTLVLFALLCFPASSAWPQAFPPNAMGVTMGHWHLNSRDIDANRKIFVAMGGTAMKAGAFDVVRFPGVIVYLHLAPTSRTAARSVQS
jgi:hypothetical protein